MPLTNMRQTIEQEVVKARTPLAALLRKPTSKAPGTRIGILQDWRGASNGKGPGQVGRTLRDGR